VRARAVTPDYDNDEPEAKPREEEDVEGFEEEVEVTPEIDEAIEAEPVEPEEGDHIGPATPGAEPDLGVDFEEDAGVLGDDADEDVPFLEDEEEDEVFGDDDLDGLPDKDAEDI
jgi:hypothetical protein